MRSRFLSAAPLLGTFTMHGGVYRQLKPDIALKGLRRSQRYGWCPAMIKSRLHLGARFSELVAFAPLPLWNSGRSGRCYQSKMGAAGCYFFGGRATARRPARSLGRGDRVNHCNRAGRLLHMSPVLRRPHSRPAQAAKAATASIPIVFTTGDDPVRLDVVNSSTAAEIDQAFSVLVQRRLPKRLQLLRELIPTASTVALLMNPAGLSTRNWSRCRARLRATGGD
jgi:hypothetical protein